MVIKFYKAILFLFIVFCGAVSLYAQQCDVIYVTTTGVSSGGNAGTRANPASLRYGLALAGGAASTVWVAAGNYPLTDTIGIPNGVTIEGGFDATTWVKSNATPTIIERDNTNPLPIPGASALACFFGYNISGFRLQDLTIIVDDAAGSSVTTYGIYLNGCSNYNIVRCNVTAGAGSNGINGTPGTAGVAGGNGSNGAAYSTETTPSAGGAGGTGGGGNGGTGAVGGGWQNSYGAAATAGSCPGGGTGGAAGNTPHNGPGCGCGLFGSSRNNSCSGTAPTAGTAGANGANGTTGANGPAGSVIAPGFFAPGGVAGTGTAGTGGCGGGGGGGGSGRQQPGADDIGGGGGGGGAGGGGGTGGTGGTGGGGSFAVFLYANGAGGNITDCLLTAGQPGQGGIGGLGGAPGAPGVQGQGGAGFCGAGFSEGAAGGPGGAGGAGGNGGNGAAGISAALEQNAGTTITQNGTTVPGNPPVITVQNYGCTNAGVIFTATTSGTWNFGTGATPATASGTGPIDVIYGSVGRKTITFSGTTFTDFVDIFNSQNISPVTETANPAISGCPDAFSTSIVGTNYRWVFGALAIPPTDSGATASTDTAYFVVPGSYTVSVYVQTACCGIVKDSTTVTVNTNTLNITLTEVPNTPVCQGSRVVYYANPTGYQNYSFYIDDSLIYSGATDSLVTYALKPGDSVNVLGFNGTCYTNPSATAYPVIKPIPAPPVLAYAPLVDSICGGDTVTYTATPGYSSYIFSDGSSIQQQGPSNVWITNTLPQGNVVGVQAYQNGCESLKSNIISLIIKQTPFALITDNVTNICQGTSDTVYANTVSGSSYQFFVNGVSVQNSSAYAYITNGFNNGDNVSVVITNDGCSSKPASVTITVRPTPSVTLTSSAPGDTICQGTPITFTASPAGDSIYTFFNGSTLIQSGATPTYTTNTLVSNSAISVAVLNKQNCPGIPSDTIVTVVNPAPVVSAGTAPAPVCLNAQPVTIAGFSPTGGTWAGAGVTDPVNGVLTPSVALAGTHEEVYTYDDPNTGCPGRDSLVFTVNPLPAVVIVPAAPGICVGDSTQLQATGGTGYAWSPATGLSSALAASPIASPGQTTTYNLTVTDANNCTATDSVTVTVNPKPTALFTATPVCAGLPVYFQNTSTPTTGVNYLWLFGDGNSATTEDPSHVFNHSDSFAVTLIIQQGACFDTTTQPLFIYPAATANFATNTLTSFNDSSDPVLFYNQSANATIWNWNFGDNLSSGLQNPTHVYSAPGAYTITLVANNQYGCQDTITKVDYINIYPLPALFIPNAFTPGQGTANNILKVYTSGAVYFDWVIFDRWGEKVYQSNNPNEGWDGTFKGKLAPMGVYSYFLKIVFDDGQPRQYKGGVTLLR